MTLDHRYPSRDSHSIPPLGFRLIRISTVPHDHHVLYVSPTSISFHHSVVYCCLLTNAVELLTCFLLSDICISDSLSHCMSTTILFCIYSRTWRASRPPSLNQSVYYVAARITFVAISFITNQPCRSETARISATNVAGEQLKRKIIKKPYGVPGMAWHGGQRRVI